MPVTEFALSNTYVTGAEPMSGWKWSHEERVAYRKALPRKRQIASLVAHYEDRLLLVKPQYRDGWLLPGGVVEYGESPAQCCERESREELGLHLPVRRLCLVDYGEDPGDGSGESIHFWFECAPLTADQVDSIQIPEDELDAFLLTTVDEARKRLVGKMARRLDVYLAARETDSIVYSENGCRRLPTA